MLSFFDQYTPNLICDTNPPYMHSLYMILVLPMILVG